MTCSGSCQFSRLDLAVMRLVHHYGRMRLDVRKTTPFTAGEDEQIRAFSQPDTLEHEALERVSPVPLRVGSEGAVVRALALLGMEYVREHTRLTVNLAAGYEELAAERAGQDATVSDKAREAGMRANMARRASPSSATRAR